MLLIISVNYQQWNGKPADHAIICGKMSPKI